MRNVICAVLLTLLLFACRPDEPEQPTEAIQPVEQQTVAAETTREGPPPPTKTRVPPLRDVPQDQPQKVPLVEYELTPPAAAGDPAVLRVRGTALLDCPPVEVQVGEPDAEGRIEIALPALTKGCENQPRNYKLRVELGPYAAGEYSLWVDGEEVAAWTQP